MRIMTTITIAALAVLTAAPAIAQNTAEPSNTADMTTANVSGMPGAATTNDAGTSTNTMGATGNAAMPTAPVTTNESNVTTVALGTYSPAPEKKSFPWGIIGLLGLLGFIPRARRRS